MIYFLISKKNFPIVAGRMVLRHASVHGWAVARERDFYREYSDVLSSAAQFLGTNLYTLEMLLFAKAPELLQEAFPDEEF